LLFQLDKSNELQNGYYKNLMPSVFQGLQDMDEKRTKYFRTYLIQATESEKNVYPILTTCLDGILRASGEINETLVRILFTAITWFLDLMAKTRILMSNLHLLLQDCQQVIERFKTGFQPPEDIPFEDLSAIKCGEAPPPQMNGHGNTLRGETHLLTYKGTLSSGKLKKRSGIFGIFGNNKVCLILLGFGICFCETLFVILTFFVAWISRRAWWL